MAIRKPQPDPSVTDIAIGLREIDDLERAIVEARLQTWRFCQVGEGEIAQLLPGVVAFAKTVADQMRREYRERSGAR